VVNLFIPEPLPAEAELPPGKRGLVYPVVVSLAVQDSSEVLPPPPTHGPDQRHWRRCRRPRSPQPTSSGVAPGSPKSNPQGPPHSLGMTRPTVTHTAPPVATAPVQEVDTAGNVMMAPPFPKDALPLPHVASVEDLDRAIVVGDPPASSASKASARPSSPAQPSPDGAASRLQGSFLGRREELDGTSQQAALDSFLGP
jgi:hypothetical protein